MPGIVGIIGAGNAGDHAALRDQMLRCMQRDSSSHSGTYQNVMLRVTLGWVAHKNSFAVNMPVWNDTHDICLIFSGEEFTDSVEIESLQAKGCKCSPENAEYLIHLYEKTGHSFYGKLNGWFSGVLVDLREKTVILFNDRFGLGRIYYHEGAEAFYFASEAKSLLRAAPELRRLDLNSLAETISMGCVLQNRTLFPGIGLLPAGSRWLFTGNRRVKKEKFFEPAQWTNQPALGADAYYEKLKETFTRILPRYFRGPERVGMSLTGGLDGRMIMAWANQTPGGLPCYTFGGTYRDCFDVTIARQVAQACQQSHQTLAVGEDFFSRFPALAEESVYVSDGTMDVTGAVELYANRLARQIAPIRLTGNYGSEILRGSVAFGPSARTPEYLDPDLSKLVCKAASTYEQEVRGNTLGFIAFKQVPWHHYSRLSVERSQLTLRSPYLDNDLVATAFQVPADLTTSNKLALRLIADGSPALARIATDRGLAFKPVPLLTALRHLGLEFTFKAEYAYDYGMPQWLAAVDHRLAQWHLERAFLGRHKFYHFRVWYRDWLSKYVEELLLDPSTLSRPYWSKTSIERLVREHTQGRRNHTSEIHRLLTIELIQRRFIEQRQQLE